MKSQTLRQKYMGSDWYFVPDVKLPKTSRYNPEKLDEIDTKFKNMYIEPDVPIGKLNRKQSEELFVKAISSRALAKAETEAKLKSLRYRSPWYIPPKHWQKLAQIPEVNMDYAENRAKNLYYYLHKNQPNLNPLRKNSVRNNKFDF